MRAAAEYLWAAARNARIIIQLTEAAKQNATPAVMETAERLQRNASMFCVHAVRVIPRLWLAGIVPDCARDPLFIAEHYTVFGRGVSMLRVLLYSNRTGSSLYAGTYSSSVAL